MSSATTDAAAENAPPTAWVKVSRAKDAKMCAAAPNHTHTHQPTRPCAHPHPLLVCSAEMAEQLATKDEQLATKDEQLATKDEQIDALTKQVGTLDVTIMRAVYQGTGKAYFTYNPGGTSKKYLKPDDDWVFEEEEEVLARVAAHEATMGALKSSSPAK